MSTNNTYLVVFLGSKTGMTEWNELTEEKRQAKKQEGIAAWKSWNEKHRLQSSAWADRWARRKRSLSTASQTQATIWEPSWRGFA